MENKSQDVLEAEAALKPLEASVVSTLVENHKRFLAFLTSRVGSEAVAEDLLQQSLKKVLSSPPAIEQEANLIAWFYRVLKNALTDHYRSQEAEKRKTENFTEHSRQMILNQAAEADFEAGLCACFKDLLPTLRPEYADLIQRIDLNGERIADVAKELNLSENNLHVRLHRGRLALRKSLERTCGTCTKHGCLNCTCETC